MELPHRNTGERPDPEADDAVRQYAGSQSGSGSVTRGRVGEVYRASEAKSEPRLENVPGDNSDSPNLQIPAQRPPTSRGRCQPLKDGQPSYKLATSSEIAEAPSYAAPRRGRGAERGTEIVRCWPGECSPARVRLSSVDGLRAHSRKYSPPERDGYAPSSAQEGAADIETRSAASPGSSRPVIWRLVSPGPELNVRSAEASACRAGEPRRPRAVPRRSPPRREQA
jgi:hypothetical protein